MVGTRLFVLRKLYELFGNGLNWWSQTHDMVKLKYAVVTNADITL